jgi:hypothetical protein
MTLRQHRYNKYKERGFFPYEAREMATVSYSEAPYLKHIIDDRYQLRMKLILESRKQGWSKTRTDQQYQHMIERWYINNDWIKHGLPDVWEMFKEYRQRAIDAGEYHPSGKKNIHRKGNKLYIHIYKGDVQAQKARARVKIQNQKGTPEYQKYQNQRREQKRRARERANE